MNTKIITVVCKKGGVGKTATAQNIGSGLALHGFKTLLIDLDAQKDLTSYYYASKFEMESLETTMLEVLTRQASAKSAIVHTKNKQLDLIPASKGLATLEKKLTAPVGNEERLREALEPILDSYDYIVIDTPRIMDLCTTNALVACTDVLITAECDEASLDALEDTLEMIYTIRKYRNKHLNVLGVLVTRFKNTIIQKRNLNELINIARTLETKVLETQIRECTAVQESRSEKKSVFEYAPSSNTAKDYNEIVKKIIHKE